MALSVDSTPTQQRTKRLETPVNRIPKPARGGPDNNDEHEGGNGAGNGPNTGVALKTRPKTKKPSMYKVLMLNDDYTPMEFVVMALERVFNRSHEDAMQIMLHVHQKGVGVCGVYTYEVAETKATQVMEMARLNQHPLQCSIEKDA